MSIPRRTYLFGALLGFVIAGIAAYNPLENRANDTCLLPKKMSRESCPAKVPKDVSEFAWGQVGAIAYQASAQLMTVNNENLHHLDETQKRYLRPYFGDLVDRVVVAYNATLMEDWIAASFKIDVGESNAQVYGNKIFIKDIYKPGDFEQIVLLAHELVHCEQYERLGNLGNFGYHYFKQYKRSGESYQDNLFEQEAFYFEAQFSKWLAAEMAKEKESLEF